MEKASILSFENQTDSPAPLSNKLLLAAGFVFLLGITGASLAHRYFPTPTPTPQTTTPTLSPSPVTQTSTYTNSDYGFSFNYPLQTTPVEAAIDANWLKVSFDNFADIEIVESQNLDTAVESAKTQYIGHYFDKLDSETPTTVDGIPAVRLDFSLEGTEEKGSRVVIFKEGTSYIVSSSTDSIGQIISTFKFTN
jgi:hypothetical protein